MLLNTVLKTVTAFVGIALFSSAVAGESRLQLNEFAVSWQGDGELQVTKNEQGEAAIQCECRGDVRVTNEQFEARAKRLVFDSAKQSLLLEGDVRLKMKELNGQPIVGEMQAERVTVKMVKEQLRVETFSTKLIGTVRLRSNDGS